MKIPVYMDYHATTPVDQRVVDAMLPYFTATFGNPASRQHKFGWMAEEAVESSRGAIAHALHAQPKEIVFTAGATEANNLALKGVAEAWRQKGTHDVTVQTEHKSVLDSCKKMEKSGFQVTYLPVDESGLVSLDELRNALTPGTVLVSIMAANNEIGTLQSIGEIGSVCREQGVFFHTDATQAIGKIPIDVDAMKIDLLSFSGHKIYGPKGIGALYVRKGAPIESFIKGGHQESGLRAGTYSASPILGDGKIYVTSEEGVTSVFSAGPKFELIAENAVDEYTLSSIAISQGQLFLRTDKHLYAIGGKR